MSNQPQKRKLSEHDNRVNKQKVLRAASASDCRSINTYFKKANEPIEYFDSIHWLVWWWPQWGNLKPYS